MKIKPLLLIAVLLMIPAAYAYDFSINDIENPGIKPYQGETADLTTSITMAGSNVCVLTCTYKTEEHDGWIGDNLVATQVKNFGFKVEAKGTDGYVSTPLIVNCIGKQEWNCYPWPANPPTETRTETVNFYFDYKGDGICTTRNDYESCITAKYDCGCGQYKSCIDDEGDSRREVDGMKCATYCGNTVVEGEFETCNNCPVDVGKCDGEFCDSADECEGSYCVHSVCSHSPYRLNDGFCDTEAGENCKNSAKDCACGRYERCGSEGVCETFCGNSICEADEHGKCAEDCNWCGDNICQAEETCRGCPSDCGECKRTEDEEMIRELEFIKEEAQDAWKIKVRMIAIAYGTFTIALIIFALWIAFRLIRAKKLKKPEPKRRILITCSKCKAKNLPSAKFCYRCGKKFTARKITEKKKPKKKKRGKKK